MPPYKQFAHNPNGFERKDAVPGDGTIAGSEPQLIIDQLLDRNGVAAGASTLSNPYFAADVVRAFDDHLIDHWLNFDQRFYGDLPASP